MYLFAFVSSIGNEERTSETFWLECNCSGLGRRVVAFIHAGNSQYATCGTRNRLFHQLFKSNVMGWISIKHILLDRLNRDETCSVLVRIKTTSINEHRKLLVAIPVIIKNIYIHNIFFSSIIFFISSYW